jgi:hypothetical protein
MLGGRVLSEAELKTDRGVRQHRRYRRRHSRVDRKRVAGACEQAAAERPVSLNLRAGPLAASAIWDQARVSLSIVHLDSASAQKGEWPMTDWRLAGPHQ